MNSGVFGMASGQVGSARKLAGRVGLSTPTNATPITNSGSIGVAATGFSASTTRTKIVNVTGKGALRWLAFVVGVAATSNQRWEVVIDGVTVINSNFTSVSASTGKVVFGSLFQTVDSSGPAYYPVAALDYAQFDQSLEIYCTGSVNESATYFCGVDLHQ